MKLVLCTRAGSPSAAALRGVMWSRWSHSAVYDEEEQVVYHSGFFQGGVRDTPAAEFFEHYTTHEIQHLEVVDISAGRVWLKAQVGKKYDWTALLSWIVRRDWQKDDCWFCSELTEAFITLFVRQRFRAQMSRITPAHQDMVVAES